MRPEPPLDLQILDPCPRPESVRVASVARRIAAIGWFPPLAPRPGRNVRVGRALQTLATAAGIPAADAVEVLDGPGGRARLLEDPEALRDGGFRKALVEGFDAALHHLAPERVRRLPSFLDHEGGALILRPGAIPLDETRLASAFHGRGDPTLPEPLLRYLVDLVLWECGAALAMAWAAADGPSRDLGAVLSLYEEGLFPVRFDRGKTTLWAVGHGGVTEAT